VCTLYCTHRTHIKVTYRKIVINDPLSQYTTVQSTTVQYNKVTHISQSNTQHSTHTSTGKITKNLGYILYTTKTQKRVEPEVNASESSKITEKIENLNSEESTEYQYRVIRVN